MNSSIYRFTLDLHSAQSQISIPVMQGDTQRTFRISLSDGSNPYIIADGCLAKISIKRPTGTHLEAFCAIEGNTTIVYKFEQNENTAAVEGIHDCDITLYDADGGILGSARFTMVVSERVITNDDIMLNDEDFTAIDAILQAEASRQEAETNREGAESQRAEAEAKRVEAETQRAEAEEERKTSCEKLLQAAEVAQASEASAKESAEEAKKTAEELNRIYDSALDSIIAIQNELIENGATPPTVYTISGVYQFNKLAEDDFAIANVIPLELTSVNFTAGYLDESGAYTANQDIQFTSIVCSGATCSYFDADGTEYIAHECNALDNNGFGNTLDFGDEPQVVTEEFLAWIDYYMI